MKISTNFACQWLLLTFVVAFLSSSTMFAMPLNTAIESKTLPEDFHEFYYIQTLDHFNYKLESYRTFRQRYVINRKYWKGAGAPILAYLGEEEAVDAIIGVLTNHAMHFQALLVYIEHRYYGKSIPFISKEMAFSNANTLGYLNSAQALADYAEILIRVKKLSNAKTSPIIVVGQSYGGMLASWFRLKYPHIALGALASSAPILHFDDITRPNAFALVISNDFKEASESCYATIKQSWSKINEIASGELGLTFLSKRFKTCNPLRNSAELKNYLSLVYSHAAKDSWPRVKMICKIIDEAPEEDKILDKIFAVVVAVSGEAECYVNPTPPNTGTSVSYSSMAWKWQKCTEMVMPRGNGDETMFEAAPYNDERNINNCRLWFSVRPRPNWVTTYYGGYNIKLVLKRFGSNIIFSNGLKDPFSSGGVLEDISDTIRAVKTKDGTHCQDILPINDADPNWLVEMRETEFQIIQQWINQYNEDLESDISGN